MQGASRRQWKGAGVVSVVVAALLLGACAATQSPGTAAAPARTDRSELLTAGDIGPGWMSAAIATAGVQPCSSPPTITSIVGPNGVGAHLTGPGGSPELVEYTVASTAVTNAYVAAIRRLQNQSSCSPITGGQTSTAVFQRVLALPRYGEESVAMLLSIDTGGTVSQAAYVVVRHGADLTVVGYANPGPLDTSALQEYTTAALAKLHG